MLRRSIESMYSCSLQLLIKLPFQGIPIRPILLQHHALNWFLHVIWCQLQLYLYPSQTAGHESPCEVISGTDRRKRRQDPATRLGPIWPHFHLYHVFAESRGFLKLSLPRPLSPEPDGGELLFALPEGWLPSLSRWGHKDRWLWWGWGGWAGGTPPLKKHKKTAFAMSVVIV